MPPRIAQRSPVRLTASHARLIRPIPSSIWSALASIEGAKRMTCPSRPANPTSRPWSLVASRKFLARAPSGVLLLRSATTSIANINPRPRTSPIHPCRSINASSPALSCAPRSAERCGTFSRTITSFVAMAAAIAIGFPPKVEMVLVFQASAISGLAMVAPTGIPLAMVFAITIMSGSTPQCEMPNQ